MIIEHTSKCFSMTFRRAEEACGMAIKGLPRLYVQTIIRLFIGLGLNPMCIHKSLPGPEDATMLIESMDLNNWNKPNHRSSKKRRVYHIFWGDDSSTFVAAMFGMPSSLRCIEGIHTHSDMKESPILFHEPKVRSQKQINQPWKFSICGNVGVC
ncbi:predicted protein [Sclerotinia sclerotiorum 1980 UF-70]|uniref:Uncharacterized protein n=1 Tax=Sclerotinia sclerotiorum (strain ATCC 18683 / 1980 / Ss-1) TaxID=665079 RepID=A7F6J4_SCLS1|nr:predicted protein [Sclerotinia sclerotiorum 1980 UF-70]EDN98365.1 predicted protein [Sclerotinia sclerotiorum 1980 UF-70]